MPPLVKLKLLNPEDEEKVFLPLTRSSKVIAIKESSSKVLVVPKKSLDILEKAGVSYEVLEELEAYDALQALRGATTRQVQ